MRALLCAMLAVAGCGGVTATAEDAPLGADSATNDCRAACAVHATCDGVDAAACLADCTAMAPSLRRADGHLFLSTYAANPEGCGKTFKTAASAIATRPRVDAFYAECRARVQACGAAVVPGNLCALDDDRPWTPLRDAIFDRLSACLSLDCSAPISACARRELGDAHLVLPAFPLIRKIAWPDQP